MADQPPNDVRVLTGVPPETVEAFLGALAAAAGRLRALPERLEAARVHDAAFGKLIDAAKVREAYHDRLPATERNIDEACAVIDGFAAGLAGTPGPSRAAGR